MSVTLPDLWLIFAKVYHKIKKNTSWLSSLLRKALSVYSKVRDLPMTCQ
jgi:hypothetical protein